MAIRLGGIEFFVRANITQSTKAFTTLGRANKKLQGNLRQTKTLFGGLGNQIQSLGGALGAATAGFAAFRLANLIKDSTLLAARVQSLGTVLNNVGRIAGLNSAQIRNVEESVKRLGITTRAARQSLSQLAQANLDLRDAAKLTRIAQDAAVIAGIDSSEAFNRLVVSIQRNDVRLLRNLGIVINLNSVYRKFAQQTGRVAASLTAFEKRQLLLNEVVERGQLIQGTYEASLQDVFKQLTSMRRLVEEAAKTFGEQFIPVLEVVVQKTSEWLKAFEKGETQLSRGFLASTATAIVAVGALGTALAVVGAAFATVGGAVLAAVAAVGLALGVGIQKWVEYKLKVAETEVELRKAAASAEEMTQKIFEANKALKEVGEFGDGVALTAENLERMRVIVRKLSGDFPELAEQLQGAIDAKSASLLLRVFESRLPEALETSAQRLASFERQQIEAMQNVRAQVMRLAEEEATAAQKSNFEFTRRLQHATAEGKALAWRRRELERSAMIEERFNDLLRAGAKEFVLMNPEIIAGSEGLKKWSAALMEAEAGIRALKQAELTSVFQDFEKGIAELEQGANQAIQIIDRLENERLRLFKDTNIKRVKEFRRSQAQLVAVEVRTISELEATRKAKSEAGLNAAKTTRDLNLQDLRISVARGLKTEEQALKERENIFKRFRLDQARIRIEGEQLVQAGAEQIAVIRKAERLSIENITIALERQEDVNKRRLESAELEAKGIAPKLLKLRAKLLGLSEKFVGANRDLTRALNETKKSLAALQPGLAASLEGLSEIPPKVAFGLSESVKKVAQRFVIINRAIEANRKSLLSREREINVQFEIERRRLLGKLEEDQKEHNQRMLELTDPKADGRGTLEGLQALNDDIDEGSKALDEFSEAQERAATVVGSKMTSGLFESFDKFGDQLKNALGTLDISILSTAFEEEFDRIDKESKATITALKRELREFRDVDRKESGRENRIANQKRFNELVDAGVPAFKARQEIARLEVEQRKELDVKEKAIQERIRTAAQERKVFLEERNNLEREFDALVERQIIAARERLQIQKEFNEAKERELQLEAEALAKSEASEKRIRGISTRRKDERLGIIQGLPGASAPPGPARSVSPNIQNLDKDIKQAGDIEVKTSKSIQRLIDSVRELVGTRAETGINVNGAVEQLIQRVQEVDAESKRGAQSFKSLRLIRKR